MNKSLTVLGSKEQQGLASHVQESKSEAQLNTGQLKCLKLRQLAVKTVNLSVHLAIDFRALVIHPSKGANPLPTKV